MIHVNSKVQLLILRNQYERGHSCGSREWDFLRVGFLFLRVSYFWDGLEWGSQNCFQCPLSIRSFGPTPTLFRIWDSALSWSRILMASLLSLVFLFLSNLFCARTFLAVSSKFSGFLAFYSRFGFQACDRYLSPLFQNMLHSILRSYHL